MGAKLAPSHGKLFMSNIQDKHLYTYPQQPLLWKRFIDDIFQIGTYSMQELCDFLNNFNNGHSTIKFTQEVPCSDVHLVDFLIYKSDQCDTYEIQGNFR